MTTTKPKVQLTGKNGNAFVVIGACTKALRQAGYHQDQIDAFTEEATAGDYDHVLRTALKWCEVS